MKIIFGITSALIATVFSLSFFFVGRLFERKIDPGGGQAVTSQQVHNIYMTFGTLPTLYASLHMLTHSDPSYVFFSREDTFDVSQMPQNVKLINTPGTYSNQALAQMPRETVANIEAANKDPKYHFFTDDLRALLPIYSFIQAGVSSERYFITLLSDGTASYSGIDTHFLDGNGQTSGIDNWNIQSVELDKIFEKYQNQNLSGSDYDLMLFNDKKYMYQISQMQNVDYWVQFPEYGFIKNGVSVELRTQLMHCNLSKRPPYNILKTLTTERAEIFFNATLGNPVFEIDGAPLRDYLDELFLNSPKPIMIISDTNPNPNSLTQAGGVADQIIQKFSNDYVLMWKPHPAYTDSDSAMANKGIVVLPASLPMEVLLWSYPQVSVGGYSSTLYMAATVQQVKFFIGGLGAPLDEFDSIGLFENAVDRF